VACVVGDTWVAILFSIGVGTGTRSVAGAEVGTGVGIGVSIVVVVVVGTGVGIVLEVVPAVVGGSVVVGAPAGASVMLICISMMGSIMS